jgi:ATP-dependent Clp protease ATP-binding subunit ClpB
VLRDLEKNLNQAVRGQAPAMQTITSIIRRAKLGLKNPNRPLGSFLLLGPSGVGKTETAKAVAHHIFGKSERFLRIDMSEFGEAHTVQRLIGAPPGYVGFDVGGEITNTIKQNPYSLLLLDEIEKAHPKIFDIFLQVLDDGRLTSGQGETISFANSIVMATSNIGINEIVAAHEAGEDVSSPAFVRQTLLPLLSQSFRTEFLNRFDAIIAYEPLSEHALLAIAKQEIKKIEQRMSKHDIQFAIKTDVLLERIREHIDPRLGARPIKRFVEDTCETLIANQLLNQH